MIQHFFSCLDETFSRTSRLEKNCIPLLKSYTFFQQPMLYTSKLNSFHSIIATDQRQQLRRKSSRITLKQVNVYISHGDDGIVHLKTGYAVGLAARHSSTHKHIYKVTLKCISCSFIIKLRLECSIRR